MVKRVTGASSARLSLLGGLVGLAAVLVALSVGGAAARVSRSSSSCHSGAPPILHDGFPEPPAIYSRDGALNIRLRAAISPTRINRRRVMAMTYNGSYPGPTLVICAGDTLTAHLVNRLNQPTNLHTHGFHVSPKGNSDNVFVQINPGRSFTYRYHIPLDMDPGAYWYHSHLNPYVNDQVFQGLAGAIVEQGGLDRLPALRRVPQRWIVITDTEVRDGRALPFSQATNPRSPWIVNGVIDPTARIRPGQLQRWVVFNASSNRAIVLRFTNRQRFTVLAQDGETLPRALSAGPKLLLGPGSRRELLVRGGRPGVNYLQAAPFVQLPGALDPVPNQKLVTLRSTGPPQPMRFNPNTVLAHPLDLRTKHVDRRRVIVFTKMIVGSTKTFFINGMTFDPNRIDVTMKLNSLEQWTLLNPGHEWHTFHIHQNPFQVVSVNGRRVRYIDYQDNVAMPPGSRIVILMHPTDFTGKFVFHCHMAFHEDHGMMATVQVVRNLPRDQNHSSVVHDGGLAISSAGYESRAAPPAIRSLMLYCELLLSQGA